MKNKIQKSMVNTMKTIKVGILAIGLAVCWFSGCGVRNDPQSVAVSFLKASYNAEWDSVAELAYIDNYENMSKKERDCVKADLSEFMRNRAEKNREEFQKDCEEFEKMSLDDARITCRGIGDSSRGEAEVLIEWNENDEMRVNLKIQNGRWKVVLGSDIDIPGNRKALYIPKSVVGKVRSICREMGEACLLRDTMGLMPVIPGAIGSLSGDEDDIAGMSFKTSTEYFKVLFDFENLGCYDWSPYVSLYGKKDESLVDSVRLGLGGPKNTNGRFQNDLMLVTFHDWYHQSDQTPLLISSNVNPTNLELPFSATDTRVIPIGSKAGRDGYAWKDAYVLIARKGGDVDVIPAAEFTRARFCGGVDIPAWGIGFLDVK